MGWKHLSTASLEGVRSDEVLSHDPFCFHQIEIKINQSKEKMTATTTRREATTTTTTTTTNTKTAAEILEQSCDINLN